MNNRSIKFRQAIYDRKGNFLKFHYWGFIEGAFIGPGTGMCSTEDAHKNSDQYTGLKDRNGVEIYERDVAWLQGMKKKFVGPVVFDPHKGFQAKISKSAEVAVGFSFHLKNCKVVGNIHQYPHLITQ